MATNFELHEWVIFVQSTKIATHENKGIHNTLYLPDPLKTLYAPPHEGWLAIEGYRLRCNTSG